jgi:large subunit ribosomal protein L18
MQELIKKSQNLIRRKNRIRSKIRGNANCPRLSVYISNRQISAQLIDDDQMNTLAQVSTLKAPKSDQTLTDKAAWVGQEIAQKAQSLKIKKAVFDRNGKRYHGRIQILAESARKAGLEI